VSSKYFDDTLLKAAEKLNSGLQSERSANVVRDADAMNSFVDCVL
jgi:hypothetical protein